MRNTIRSYCAACAIGFAATAAFAECPTPDSMQAGDPAYLVYDDGWIVELRMNSDGLLYEWIRNDIDDAGYRVVSRGGILVVDEIETLGPLNLRRTRVMTRHSDVDPKSYEPEPGVSLDFEGEAIFADGSRVEMTSISVLAGDPGPLTIAGCDYEGFDVRVRVSRGEKQLTSVLSYVPALGVSVETARMEAGKPLKTPKPVSFSTGRP
ncbi:hypothetical protein CLV78_105241 [Aliiruegeria haliotis]|uniref:Uncharacterized protein n=1 Tax=Aliiruegeria haliotis TaxID=1280846 RepID=A0A2T0RPX8_9RHOB|nr:hypothetical protein [Aliiruegeria haliotis]PRY23187.1 hypothetical protein CLV78_105241 [Aliiruegeria haliotis]